MSQNDSPFSDGDHPARIDLCERALAISLGRGGARWGWGAKNRCARLDETPFANLYVDFESMLSPARAALWLPYSLGLGLAGTEGRMPETWVVLVCVGGITLTYVFRVLFARWVYRRRT